MDDEFDLEVSEYIFDPMEGISIEAMDGEEDGRRRRGRPKVAIQRTRVVLVNEQTPDQPKSYVLSTDQLIAESIEKKDGKKKQEPWEPIFLAENYLEKKPNIDLG